MASISKTKPRNNSVALQPKFISEAVEVMEAAEAIYCLVSVKIVSDIKLTCNNSKS